jgi:hypothetical protein
MIQRHRTAHLGHTDHANNAVVESCGPLPCLTMLSCSVRAAPSSCGEYYASSLQHVPQHNEERAVVAVDSVPFAYRLQIVAEVGGVDPLGPGLQQLYLRFSGLVKFTFWAPVRVVA